MPDRNTAAAASFQNADAYEQVMGRWSLRLAPLPIRFGGLSDGDRVLDVGCGTGSLAFTLPEIANVAEVTGVDLVEAFVEFARAHNTDPRITFKQADARALPFEDNSFDCATERRGATIGPTVAGDRGFESLYPFQSGYWLVGMATVGDTSTAGHLNRLTP